MGGKSSKQPSSKDEQAQPPEPPYFGPSAKYHFVTCEVSLKYDTFGFMTSSVITSNVDTYYPILVEEYAKGLKLLSFYRIPQQVQAEGFFHPKLIARFQGIYCCYPTNSESCGNYELRIEKSVLQPEISQIPFLTSESHVITDTHHLFQTIAHYADMGARLICIEITGQEYLTHSMMNPRMPSLGCDLFFEMPVGNVAEKYIYNIVCVPIYARVKPGIIPKIKVQCDWIGTLSGHLNQGWKLVEIFYDKTAHYKINGFTSETQLNSQWYFEKPVSKVNDASPIYEGTIVEHEVCFNTPSAQGWEPVIQDMGNKGWELACILETNEQRAKIGFVNKIYMKTLLFFQRKILTTGFDTDKSFSEPSPIPREDKKNDDETSKCGEF